MMFLQGDDRAVVDAGMKAVSMDSGVPLVSVSSFIYLFCWYVYLQELAGALLSKIHR